MKQETKLKVAKYMKDVNMPCLLQPKEEQELQCSKEPQLKPRYTKHQNML